MSFDTTPDASASNTRPKDAATLIIIRRGKAGPRMPMGRRSARHAFMPGAVVFRGGRVDRADWMAPCADDLRPDVAARLALSVGRANPRRGRRLVEKL